MYHVDVLQVCIAINRVNFAMNYSSVNKKVSSCREFETGFNIKALTALLFSGIEVILFAIEGLVIYSEISPIIYNTHNLILLGHRFLWVEYLRKLISISCRHTVFGVDSSLIQDRELVDFLKALLNDIRNG